ncbi:MAG: hypothetical protein GTO40_19035, partial [Deltaproteobacteria bacterium]|nr:hypothetical protein [Deltaproteobacteria bacterium]
MKKYLLFANLFLILALILVACGPGAAPTEEVAQPPEATTPPEATAPPEATTPPEAEEKTINLSMILVAPEDRWNFL